MASRQDQLTATQNIVNAVNLVARQLGNVFPQATVISSFATAGAVVPPGNFAGYITVLTSSGGSYKVPLYDL